jgi:hypothetical protein
MLQQARGVRGVYRDEIRAKDLDVCSYCSDDISIPHDATETKECFRCGTPVRTLPSHLRYCDGDPPALIATPDADLYHTDPDCDNLETDDPLPRLHYWLRELRDPDNQPRKCPVCPPR